MLQLVSPPERPRPALVASIGIHLVAASAFGFGPLLAFPEAPGWRGEVWVNVEPDWHAAAKVEPVELSQRPRSASTAPAPAGGLPAAPREGTTTAAPAPETQPGPLGDGLPTPPDVEPTGRTGVPGGDDDGGGTAFPGGGTGTDTGGGAIDIRAGLPPDIVLPVPLETPAPHYPDSARIGRVTGVVVLSATIAADGRVVEVAVEPGANPLLARAAEAAVSAWRYAPARIGARPVAVILRVTLTFRLN